MSNNNESTNLVTPQGVVAGRLVDQDGAPILAIQIVLIAKNLRSETQLGQATTDNQGQYSVTYRRPSALNLLVRASDSSGKIIAESPTTFAAAPQVEIDLTTAADGVIRTPSVFTNVDKSIAANLQTTPLADLKQNKDTHELQFLADSAGLPFKQIAHRFIANALGTKNKINDATFFGIFHHNIPPSLSAALISLPDGGIDDAFTAQVLSGVLAHSRSILDQALITAVKTNILPASYAATQDAELTLFDALRAKSMGEAPYLRGKTSLNDLLAAGGVAEPVKAAFIQTYADHNGHVESTHAKLRAKNDIAAADLNMLAVTLDAGEALGGNLPLVKDTLSRISEKTLASVQHLALLDENDWIDRITAVDPEAASIPPVLPDDPTAQRIERLAKALSERFTAKYPTTAFAGKLSKSQNSSFAKTKDEMVGFFAANPKFNFKQTNIDHFVSTNKIAVSATALTDLKVAQRLSRLVPDYDSVEALRSAGHNSAMSVYTHGRGPFLAQMATALGGASAAKLAYARAQMTYATALTAYGRYNLALNGTRVAALASAAPNPTLLTNLPDLQALFGSLDSFECADCQSVLSPAAYLVDLLQYLGKIGAGLSVSGASKASPIAISTVSPHGLQTGAQVTISGVLGNTSANGPFAVTVTSATSFTLNGSIGNESWAGGGYVSFTGLQNARDALSARRPDIQYTALSCNNTNVQIPYIDLVNEILESALAPPATPLTFIDTTGTSDERRAIPQNLAQEAYDQAASAVFPLNLPFDLAFARTTAYINALGTNRAAILSLFAGNAPTPAQASAMAGANLGINPEMQAVINTSLSPAAPPNVTQKPWDRWGLMQNPSQVIDPKTRTPYTPTPAEPDGTVDWVAALSKVPVLLNRAGITLQQLYQLLEVQWVNLYVTLAADSTTVGTLQILSPDTDLMTFSGLDGPTLDRANRFLRLWAATGLQMWELDWALHAASVQPSTGAAMLPFVSGAIAVQTQLKLPIQDVLGFWAPLETRDVTNHLSDEDTVVPSTYTKVFRNPTVLLTGSSIFLALTKSNITTASSGPNIITALPHGYQTGMHVMVEGSYGTADVSDTFVITVTSPTSFTLNGFTGTGTWLAGGTATAALSGNPILADPTAPPTTPPMPEQIAISTALGLSAADISAIITAGGAANAPLSLATLGQLLNYQRLATALSLDIPHLILWIALTGGKPFNGAPTDTLEFLRRVAVLQGTGLAAEDLNYLLLNQSPAQSSLALTTAHATAILQTIRDAVAKLSGATVLAITGATNASTIAINTALPNTLQTGAQISIGGVLGNTNANGTFTITVVNPTSFTLQDAQGKDVAGNATWISGGSVGFLTSPADPSTIQTIFINALATAFGTTANVVTPVILKTGILPLSAATITLLIAQGAAVDPTQFPALTKAFTALAKAVAFFTAVKPSEAEFAFLIQNASIFNWLDPSSLPSSPAITPYTAVETLLQAIKLNRRQSPMVPRLFDVLNQWLSHNGLPADLATAISELAAALNASITNMQAIVTQLGATPPQLTLPAQAGSLADMGMLTLIADALDVAARYRISGVALTKLAALAPTSDTASTAMATLQAQYPQSSWLAAIQPVEDVLRQNRRDVLVAYMLGHGPAASVPQMLTTDDIYDYYLIDPEMSPCSQTTRLLQPSLATQQFVQQCFLNLTISGVTVDTTNSLWDEWSWRQQYRLWQANREVFLYPENYVLPETRTDASSFFQELENELRQTNADADGAEASIENYLRSLVDVSRLQIAAHYVETTAKQETVVHVFAHTRGTPWKWYTRRRTGLTPSTGSWSAWEPLDLDINSQHLVPVVWDQRLHLVWPIFKQIAQKPFDQPIPKADGSAVPQSPPLQFSVVEFATSELSAGQWQAKQSINEKIYLNGVGYQFVTNFQALQYQAADLQIQINLYEDGPYEEGVTDEGAVDSLIAQATLQSPESPLTAAVYSTLLPSSGYIDLDQEPTLSLITNLGNTAIRLKPTAYRFWVQDLIWDVSVGLDPTLNVLCATNSAGQLVNVQLLGTITDPRIVIPQQETTFDSMDPFFVDDPTRTYLVQPLYYDSTNEYQGLPTLAGATQWYTRYAFQTFYHPFARTFLRELEIGGIPQLMARSLQVGPQNVRGWGTTFNFTSLYRPGAQVQTHYPGDNLPGNPDPAENGLDFAPGSSGAYSLYNWELFYHAPMFAASLLMQNQQFQDAMSWLQYIFNPMDSSGGASPQRYWQMAPFNAMSQYDWVNQDIQTLLNALAADQQQNISDSVTGNSITAWMSDPFDPHAIASLRISAYAKATVMKFLDNLIAWGDSYYSQYTAETVNQAEQLYILADLILGPRPDRLRLPSADQRGSGTATYASLQKLDAFSNVLVNIENVIVAPEPPQAIVSGVITTPSLPALPGNADALLFCIPPNAQLLAYWDTVSQRLYNIRSCRTLQGVVQPLPLYAPPINPLVLVEDSASGGGLLGLSPTTPVYRFTTYLQKALELTNDVRSYGSLILSALEKQDGETLASLRANQELDIQTRMLDVKKAQVAEAQDQITALKKQHDVVQTRYDFYSSRVYMNDQETSAEGYQKQALSTSQTARARQHTAAVLSYLPNIDFGISGFGGTPKSTLSVSGGIQLAAIYSAWASVARDDGGEYNAEAGLAATQGSYRRRSDDWAFQTDLANAELIQTASQITAATDRLNIANAELSIQQTQISNAQAVSTFLTNKYTGVQLYNWIVSQLTTVYAQAYQLASSLALQAQNAYQYELGNYSDTFIQFGYWDSQHKGLTAGESLMFDLRRMEAQYLAENSRELELTKHVSLALTSPTALVTLREIGQCGITLDETLFDSDYPGHYFRRLRSVALTIPCVTGPYLGVNATLNQTSAIVRLQPPGPGYQPLNATSSAGNQPVAGSPVAAAGTTTIVTSHGQNDAGLFDVNLRDERWLPFEGRGAVSNWNLTLDPRDNSFDFSTITDVILHIRYTARGGGDAEAVRKAIKSQIEVSRSILVSVRNTFGNAYYAFFNPPSATSNTQTLTLPMPNILFPYSNLGSGVKITGIDFYVTLSVSAENNTISATFGITNTANPAPLSLSPSTLKAADGSNVAALTGSATIASLPAPQSFDLIVPAPNTIVPAALATTINGVTRLDPNKVEDILLVINYSIA